MPSKHQKNNTCRIMKVPKGVYGRVFYEIRCQKKERSYSNDTTTLREARSLAKKMTKKYKIKKIYEEK